MAHYFEEYHTDIYISSKRWLNKIETWGGLCYIIIKIRHLTTNLVLNRSIMETKISVSMWFREVNIYFSMTNCFLQQNIRCDFDTRVSSFWSFLFLLHVSLYTSTDPGKIKIACKTTCSDNQQYSALANTFSKQVNCFLLR